MKKRERERERERNGLLGCLGREPRFLPEADFHPGPEDGFKPEHEVVGQTDLVLLEELNPEEGLSPLVCLFGGEEGEEGVNLLVEEVQGFLEVVKTLLVFVGVEGGRVKESGEEGGEEGDVEGREGEAQAANPDEVELEDPGEHQEEVGVEVRPTPDLVPLLLRSHPGERHLPGKEEGAPLWGFEGLGGGGREAGFLQDLEVGGEGLGGEGLDGGLDGGLVGGPETLPLGAGVNTPKMGQPQVGVELRPGGEGEGAAILGAGEGEGRSGRGSISSMKSRSVLLSMLTQGILGAEAQVATGRRAENGGVLVPGQMTSKSML